MLLYIVCKGTGQVKNRGSKEDKAKKSFSSFLPLLHLVKKREQKILLLMLLLELYHKLTIYALGNRHSDSDATVRLDNWKPV